MAKFAAIINGSEAKNIYGAIILGVSAAACGDDVVLYFTPDGAPTMLKGALERISKETEHMPDLVEMFEGLQMLGAQFIVCELSLDVHGIKEEDFREGMNIAGATTFLNEAAGADLSFTF